MDSLYDSGDYFVKIEPESSNYEEEYHLIATDPDGNKRNLLEERSRSLAQTKEITEFLSKIKPGKILDFGCGPGWILSSLDDNWEKHGIEISKFVSKTASKYAKIHTGSIETFKEKDFDLIIMNHVIEHLSDPVSVIKEIYSILKPAGKLIIGTPDFDCGAARRYGDKFRLLHDPTHISLFSNDSMHRFLRDHNFKINQVEYPYFDTEWFNLNTLKAMLNNKTISPPFYGSAMTFLCQKI
jgi:2-polyprenyl-3-methyl-5-hydroxy-6-metoxy-1,4-benzoquinol methylase